MGSAMLHTVMEGRQQNVADFVMDISLLSTLPLLC